MHINFYKYHQTGSVLSQSQRYTSDTGLVALSVKKRLLNWATLALIMLYLFYNLFYFVYGCVYNFHGNE